LQEINNKNYDRKERNNLAIFYKNLIKEYSLIKNYVLNYKIFSPQFYSKLIFHIKKMLNNYY